MAGYRRQLRTEQVRKLLVHLKDEVVDPQQNVSVRFVLLEVVLPRPTPLDRWKAVAPGIDDSLVRSV